MLTANCQEILRKLAFGVIALAAASSAQAGLITSDETAGGSVAFGRLRQTDTRACGGIDGTAACGPTAAVNSFVFLQNRYPTIYSTALIQSGPTIGFFNQDYSNLITTANLLGTPGFMNCTCAGGTDISNFLSGRAKYIDQQIGVGKTAYPFRTVFGLTPADTIKPDFSFLLENLRGNADVELLVSYHDATGYKNGLGNFYGGHYITVTGLTLDDTNGNGTFDASEALTLSFIDPATGTSGVTSGSLDIFGFDTSYGYGGAITGASIAGIIAEAPASNGGGTALIPVGSGISGTGALDGSTPVPEPGSFPVLGLGLGSLLLLRRWHGHSGRFQPG